MRKLLLLPAFVLLCITAYASPSYAEWVAYTQAVMSVTVLALMAVVGTLALHWMYRNRYLQTGGKASFLRYTWQNPLVKLVLFAVLVVVVINVVLPRPPEFESWEEVATQSKVRRMPVMATKAYRNLCQRHPDNVDYHFEYITAYYEQEEWAETTGEADIYVEEDEEDPKRYYIRLANDSRSDIQDIAKLGLGICCYYTGPRNFAMKQLQSIQDSTLPYQNLYKGRIHAAWNERDSATMCFQREIELGPQKERATKAWAVMLMAAGPEALDEISALVADDNLGKDVPTVVKRYLHHQQRAVGEYFKLQMSEWWVRSEWIGWIGALLGTLLWMVFLRRIDVGKSGSLAWMGMNFAGGALFSFLALFLYDTVHFDLGISFENRSVGHDLLYCVFGIGVIEEFVKALPLILTMWMIGGSRKPLHYFLYAGASALGFAFVENLMYFDAGHVGIMHGRILITVVFHMFASSTIAFAMVLGRYRYPRWRLPIFLAGFLVASFFHGFFDFWLMSSSVSPLVLVTYGFFVYLTFQYATYLNNGLNHTPLPAGVQALDPGRLAIFLTVGLVGILLFEYSSLGVVYGRPFANHALLNSLGMGSFMMFFVIMNLSNIDVVPGEWNWLRFWDFGSRKHLNRAIGQRLELVCNHPSGVLAKHLPLAGIVVTRVALQSKHPYFLFQLDQPIIVQGVEMGQVLIRAKQEGELLEPGHQMEVVIVAFRDEAALKRAVKRKSDFKMLDTALLP